VSLGSFVVSGTNPEASIDTFHFDGRTFTLRVYQTLPNAGNDTFGAAPSAIISGYLDVVAGAFTGTGTGVSNDQLRIDFVTTSVTLAPGAPTVQYDLGDKSTVYADGVVTLSPGVTDLRGTVTAVPLPATASTSLWLLGGVAGAGTLAKLRKRGLALAA